MKFSFSPNKWLAYGLSLMLCLTYGQTRAQSQQVKQGETPQGIDAQSWASIQKQMQMNKQRQCIMLEKPITKRMT